MDASGMISVTLLHLDARRARAFATKRRSASPRRTSNFSWVLLLSDSHFQPTSRFFSRICLGGACNTAHYTQLPDSAALRPQSTVIYDHTVLSHPSALGMPPWDRI